MIFRQLFYKCIYYLQISLPLAGFHRIPMNFSSKSKNQQLDAWLLSRPGSKKVYVFVEISSAEMHDRKISSRNSEPKWILFT